MAVCVGIFTNKYRYPGENKFTNKYRHPGGNKFTNKHRCPGWDKFTNKNSRRGSAITRLAQF